MTLETFKGTVRPMAACVFAAAVIVAAFSTAVTLEKMLVLAGLVAQFFYLRSKDKAELQNTDVASK